eukprot:6129969-Prymnesium_polylepis.1
MDIHVETVMRVGVACVTWREPAHMSVSWVGAPCTARTLLLEQFSPPVSLVTRLVPDSSSCAAALPAARRAA